MDGSVTLLEATVAMAALTIVDQNQVRRKPPVFLYFSPCSDNCDCEKSVTELPARPTSARNGNSDLVFVVASQADSTRTVSVRVSGLRQIWFSGDSTRDTIGHILGGKGPENEHRQSFYP